MANRGCWQKSSRPRDVQHNPAAGQIGRLTESARCTLLVRPSVKLRGPVIGSSKKIRNEEDVHIPPRYQIFNGRLAKRRLCFKSCNIRELQGGEPKAVRERNVEHIEASAQKKSSLLAIAIITYICGYRLACFSQPVVLVREGYGKRPTGKHSLKLVSSRCRCSTLQCQPVPESKIRRLTH